MKDTAARFGVSRQTLHAWLAMCEACGAEAFGDGSHRPRSCPHQMPAVVEVAEAELRRAHPAWGPRRGRADPCARWTRADGAEEYWLIQRLSRRLAAG